MAITVKDAAGATQTVETDVDSGTGVHTSKTNLGTTPTSAADGAALPGKGNLLAADNGSVAKFVQSDTDGNLKVVPSSGSEFQVDIVDIGTAASAANQLTINAQLTTLNTGVALAANQNTIITTLASLDSSLVNCDTGNITIGAALPAGTNNIGDVDVATLPGLPSTVSHGAYTLAGSSTAYQLSSGASVAATEAVQLKAGASNAATLWVGGSAAVTNANGWPLAAGEQVTIVTSDVQNLYCYGSSGDSIAWLVS